LFARCGGLFLPPLNDMEVPAHIPDGRMEDVAMEMSNPSVQGESAGDVLSGKGLKFQPPYK